MPSVAVIGTGTMGAGIAQVAACAGWNAYLIDASTDIAERARTGIRAQLTRLAEKGKLTADAADAVAARLRVVAEPAMLGECELLIEAIVEDLETKIKTVVGWIKHLPPTAICASNTSSLSVTRIGYGVGVPDRTVGMHFFNPVPLMPLVEVISGEATTALVGERAAQIATEWGKSVVRAKDTPGFIVNRVARGYYLEPLRMLSEGIAGVDELDGTLKSLVGFRMGPFELMDLIGIDVNYSVSASVWEQLRKPARLTPHPLQRSLVDRGHLGRKTKRGFYSYDGETPLPAIPLERRSFQVPAKMYQAVRRFADVATVQPGSITEQYVVARTLAAIINEAAMLLEGGVASAEHIDLAMKLGTNYPFGPLELAETVGRHTCAALLRAMNAVAGDDRFAPAAWLAD